LPKSIQEDNGNGGGRKEIEGHLWHTTAWYPRKVKAHLAGEELICVGKWLMGDIKGLRKGTAGGAFGTMSLSIPEIHT
jgi:hypothetical protein